MVAQTDPALEYSLLKGKAMTGLVEAKPSYCYLMRRASEDNDPLPVVLVLLFPNSFVSDLSGHHGFVEKDTMRLAVGALTTTRETDGHTELGLGRKDCFPAHVLIPSDPKVRTANERIPHPTVQAHYCWRLNSYRSMFDAPAIDFDPDLAPDLELDLAPAGILDLEPALAAFAVSAAAYNHSQPSAERIALALHNTPAKLPLPFPSPLVTAEAVRHRSWLDLHLPQAPKERR